MRLKPTFKAFTVSYSELPPDVDLEAFRTEGVEQYYEEYLVVQRDDRTVFCKPESQLSDGTLLAMELMELTYYLGVLDGVRHERRGKTLH